MAYRVSFTAHAARQFHKLPKGVQEALRPAIEALAGTPRPPGCATLAGARGQYRIRVGQYRVLYGVDDSASVVLVVAVGHRREVYR
ncbi:MAG: type II toxin-antitoxin system RelE/ParE family toxin [Planctomycetota bacterium]|nr:type II toxin-antitoxin system RelE/ParE family toxin [Planctomycetota bacterium]